MPPTALWTPLRYHSLQAKLWRTRAHRVAVMAGRGSGKTELARRRMVRYLPVKKPWANPMYAYCMPTYRQAKRVAWEKLKALVPGGWLAKRHGIMESELTIRTEFGSSITVVGMDKPERVEGDQWDGFVLDESSDQKPRAFALSVQPACQHRDAWVWRIGVCKRFGVGAGEFLEAFDQYSGGTLGADYEAYTWPSWDILSPEKIEAARRELDEVDFAEQYGAQRQEIGGRIFHAFSDKSWDQDGNVSEEAEYRPGECLVVGSDFNVNPMAWCLMHFREHTIDVFGEVWLRNTHTQATLDHLHTDWGHHRSGWLFIGDATAKSRNTRASESDYAQILNDTRFEMSVVRYPKHNPSRVDRFAACNRLFRNAAGERTVRIHPRCKRLIHDLKERAYSEGSREPDDSHPDRGHMSDAFGYPIHYLRPVVPTEDSDGQFIIENEGTHLSG